MTRSLAMSALLGAGLAAGCRAVQRTEQGSSGRAGQPAGRRVELAIDREGYSPLMSSVLGIGITPRYSEAKTSPPFRYHWHTNYGYFVQGGPPDYQVKELGPDASTAGGKVYWSYDPMDMDQRDKPEVEIVVKVRDAKTLATWSETRLRLGWDDADTARVMGEPHAP